MAENLVIVESPAKAKTISNFLGKNFLVKSSFGHIRDLSKDNFGIDIEHEYTPEYIIPEDKKKIVNELRETAKGALLIWLASDEDREGEAIAWHLTEVLNLKPERIRRITFHEITRNAIEQAIQNPRGINHNLVNSQQARRVLDRLVGFELSPILWKKIKSALSAGRVQSVAVRLLVEREREINLFQPESTFKLTALFNFKDKDDNLHELSAELPSRLKNKNIAYQFLEKCIGASFKVIHISKKPTKKSPAPPFTTSTLQQEASRKLGFSVSHTMNIAQRLYEAGKITYMRTDSVNLSNIALGTAKKVIASEFGNEYIKIRNFKTKTKRAQEAHEAIRPTYLQNKTTTGNRNEQRLYELIWKRTIASQMSEAELEKTTAKIAISTADEQLVAVGEVLKFDGFLKVYIESTDEDNNEEQEKGLLPPIRINDLLYLVKMATTEKYSTLPSRFSEANLVKKLEELGIGRPSTYAPIISTIQQRGYAVKEDRPGKERRYVLFTLQENNIIQSEKKEKYGIEKAKLFPTDIGILVNDFLVEHFEEILNYNFTANVEKEFDKIAAGQLKWTHMIDKFYHPFHQKVVKTILVRKKPTGERLLGNDPDTGKPVSVKIGRYGPMVQIGDASDQEKPRFASLLKGQSIETITLEEALSLFSLPRSIGEFEETEIIIGVGKFGPYIRHKSKFYALKKGTDDPLTIELERAIQVIEEKREQERKKLIMKFEEDPDLLILNGRWGPYISYKKENFRIPKDIKPESLTIEKCIEIIQKSKKNKKPKK